VEAKIISREFIFGSCGIIVIEGEKLMIEGISDMIRIMSYKMEKTGKLPHETVRTFMGVFASEKWRAKFPEMKITKAKVTCPEGKLCVH
jgi:hypothetical protein